MSESNDITARRAKLTPAQLALLQRRLRREDHSDATDIAVPRPSREGIAKRSDDGSAAPVSFMQQGQWFLWQLDAGNTAYHVGGGLGFSGPLDVAALQAALHRLVQRHDSLRTVFGAGPEGLPEQRIDPSARVDIPFADLSALDAATRAVRHREAVLQVCRTPFDLTTGPLLRGALLKMEEGEHQLLLMLHHIVCDAWTVELILDELAQFYAQQVDGVDAHAGPGPEIRYIDFARWQHRWLEGEEGARQLAHWRQRLGGRQPVLDLATDRPRSGQTGYRAVQHVLDVPAPLVRELKQQARAQGGTLFMVLLAAFHAVLFRYTGQEEIRVGVPVAGRNRPETAGVVGAFINTVVMDARLNARMPLAELLAQVRDTAFEAQSNQELPYERLVQALRADGGHAGAPLFQVMFNHLGEGDRPLRGWPGLVVRRIDLEERAAPFELTLETIEREDGSIRAAFRYAAELFEPATIARLAGHYHRVLAADPRQALGALALLDDAEHAQLAAWGVNTAGHGEAEPVHHVIARRAVAHPDAQALVFGDETLSYAELERRANRLAHRLIARGVRPESLVGVALERSNELVIALLAVLKAGGAYVPIDPEHPPARIAYIVQDSGLALVLTQERLRDRWPADAGITVLTIDAADADGAPDSDPAVALDAENLAYVIYTSGSTGKPKGAANRHRALHNRLAWMQQAYGLGAGDTVLQKTPFSFDVSVWEFFWPLMVGARLAVAAPGDHRDPARLVELIRRHGVSTLHFVPSMLQALLTQPDVESCTSLRRIVCSGEALPAEAQNEVLARLPQARLYNLYGPTEAAIDVTHWTCRADGRSQVAIGQPISGIRTHVLDASLNLVPQGVAGELYLGGIGLARGYAKRPGLTSERFVADPFDATGGGRLYRTGDLVRWNSQGQLDYLGRLDHQVKIRGFRIELGEIEAQLLAHPQVREAVVVTQQAAGGVRLAAYVSLRAGQDSREPDAQALREWLGRTLPEYMVPSLLMTLPGLPLNANGKIDRKALPPIQATDPGTHTAPTGALEEALARVWTELLGVTEVGREANFFELGGHSLMAAQLVSRLRAGAGLHLPLREVFDHPVLRDMATRLAPAGRGAAQPTLMPVARSAQISLSPTQHRLWLVDRLSGKAARTAYNMATALRFEGPLDPAVLRRALETLASRHEVLRMAYPENDDGEPVATIAPVTAFDLPWIDLSPVAPEAEAARIDAALEAMAAQPFDLAAAAPLRASLLHLAPGRHALLLCVHHIAFDGWSGAIFAREFVAAYEALRADRASTLPPLRVQYADYAVWHARMLEATRAQDTAFWQRYLNHAPKGSRLPVDAPLPGVAGHAGDSVRVPIEGALVEALAPLAQANKTSRFTVMLAAFLALVHREAATDDVVVGTDVAGRDHPELEKLMGFFVNVVPLRSRRNKAERFTDWLAQVHASTQSALAHGGVPFDRILDLAGLGRAQGSPVRMLFVMQNTPAGHFEIPGLRIDVVPQRVRHSKFDIAVFVHEGPREWNAEWVYDTGLYRSESIRRWATEWCALLRQLVISPEARIELLFSTPVRKESAMNPMPSPQLGKLDKLKKFAARPAAVAATVGVADASRPQVKTSFLSEARPFPLVIEPASAGFDAIAWVREHRGFVDDALARHGGLLFRNFGLETPQDFEAFAENVEPELYGSYGDLPKKEGGRRTYRSTPYPERQMILFHNESSHMDRWPRKQWFYCELPSRVGGATPIVDCREMLRRLPAEIVEAFERKALTYVRTFTPHLDVSWRDFFKTDQRAEVEARLAVGGIEWRWLDEDTLQTRTHCPAVMKHPLTGERVFFNQVQLHHPACLEADVREDLLALVGAERMPRHVCYGDGTPIDDETMAIVGRTYEACAVRFDWRKGDVVMLDNMLAAHARDPYEGPRKIVVAMGAMFERSTLRAAEAVGSA
ncbi:non-ribosomal peptide synthetase [Variovorax sp. RO1]|uniref:non-ribosomal peptide synthetase n=1 Tax=Variovorax sp. RO1 TaxID=2066034 RepID=UPI000C716A62|nr:non-ribosomal peptide synthetase [Variovorax sp. RO1]PLC06711.1 non-ribosomal peptide synthetase [Variovorax sp. RO1]